jgi:NAD(P)-dependent dehydrogenase (short-subunit alcohol dehydrogenase family)
MVEGSEMRGKRVLVTGGGTGIGKGIAQEFARRGAAVALHYSSSEAGARATVEEIRSAGGTVEAFHADFTDVEQVQAMTRRAIEFLGGLDVLVNNAGWTTNIALENATPRQWDALFHINVRGMYFASQIAVEPMLEQGHGVIVNITSVHAFHAMRDHTIYASTKAAIVGFTRTLAVELAPRGIRVNAIAPGAVVVDSYYRNKPDFDWDGELVKSIPAGFVARPSDIAGIAVFLASNDARYIVGQTIVADGGQNACITTGDGFQRKLDFTWNKQNVSST